MGSWSNAALDANESIAEMAVERAMTEDERLTFAAKCLHGSFDGATAADWISIMSNNDQFLDITEPWAEENYGPLAQEIMDRHGLPERASYRVLRCALYASIGITRGNLSELSRPVAELAHAAAATMRER